VGLDVAVLQRNVYARNAGSRQKSGVVSLAVR
jgi:hypothetical protein